MRSRIKKSDIYAIVDIEACRNVNISNLIKKLIKNNIKIIQLRDKKSHWKKVLEKAVLFKKIIDDKALLIINDCPEIAILSDASGVHLGQDDLDLKLARKILGKDKIIGKSTHSLQQAIQAQKEGADYIGFGPIFKTPTKKEYKAIGTKQINLLKRKLSIPFFLIGSIDTPQLKKLSRFKIKRIAVCRALCKTKNTGKKIKELRNHLKTVQQWNNLTV